MRTSILVFVATIYLGIAGCGFKNMHETRQPQNMSRHGSISKSLHDINMCINRHIDNCGAIRTINFIDEEQTKAIHIEYRPGWTQAIPFIVVDFSELSDQETEYKAYTFYKMDGTVIDEWIQDINNCGECSR